MKKTIMILSFLILSVSLLIPCQNAIAEVKTFVREYRYEASKADNKISCRTISLVQIKRMLLEELGTYLESETEVKNYQLTKDKITILSAGIVKTIILAEKWDGKTYWMRAKIEADPDKVTADLDRLRKDRDKTRELEELRAIADKALKDNERLRKELAQAKGAAGREKIQAEYNANISILSSTGWFEKGYDLENSGDLNGAIEAYTKAIELQPTYAIIYSNRGNVYDSLGDHAQAIKDYDKAIELDPAYMYAYYNRGLTYANLGNYQEAIINYDKAIELAPTRAEPYVNRGFAYDNLGNYQEAINDFNKAIELDPTDAMAYNNRGAANANLKRWQEALEDWNKSVEVDPKYANAYYNRGILYDQILGNHQEAVNDMKAAARLGDKSAQEWLTKNGESW